VPTAAKRRLTDSFRAEFGSRRRGAIGDHQDGAKIRLPLAGGRQ
jgi:hypothetical protein